MSNLSAVDHIIIFRKEKRNFTWVDNFPH